MRVLLLIAGILLFVSNSLCHAALIAVEFSGDVDLVWGDPTTELSSELSNIRTVSVRYIFDSSSTDTYTSDPNIGIYRGGLNSISVNVDNGLYQWDFGSRTNASDVDILVQNDLPGPGGGDFVNFISDSPAFVDDIMGLFPSFMQTHFSDSTSNMFNDISIPDAPFIFELGVVQLAFGDPSNPSHQVGIQFTPVPVPAAIWLFGSALIGLIGMRKIF
ncbi:hypothetical protein D1AOALGA4SA_2987 [Olavius algarvensis Delta 1 endosymbiont]|nr:hypothetical protein D1AOALGA4SA_2987 [Olavius algarvensis Delta 1 endosymbiont]